MMTLIILISLILFKDSDAWLSCYYPSQCSKNCSENSVCATVQNGQDLILTYNVAPNNLDWVTCKWGRYVPAESSWEKKFEYFMFGDITQYYRGNTLTCRPSDFMEKTQMEYISKTQSKCEIKVGNTSNGYEKGSWESRTITWRVSLDTDRDEKTISIRLGENTTKSMDPNSVQAGDASTNAKDSMLAFDKYWNVAAIIMLIIVLVVVVIGEVVILYMKYRLKEDAMKF